MENLNKLILEKLSDEIAWKIWQYANEGWERPDIDEISSIILKELLDHIKF